MEQSTLTTSAENHCAEMLDEHGRREWALSVFSHPSADVAEICRKAWPIISHTHVRITTVGKIREFGYDVIPDGKNGHCLIPLGPPPWDADWQSMTEHVFQAKQKNPEKERRRK